MSCTRACVYMYGYLVPGAHEFVVVVVVLAVVVGRGGHKGDGVTSVDRSMRSITTSLRIRIGALAAIVPIFCHIVLHTNTHTHTHTHTTTHIHTHIHTHTHTDTNTHPYIRTFIRYEWTLHTHTHTFTTKYRGSTLLINI